MDTIPVALSLLTFVYPVYGMSGRRADANMVEILEPEVRS